MTHAERKEHRRAVLHGAAAELASHPDNGSDWLFSGEQDGACDLSQEAHDFRIAVLKKLIDTIDRMARR